MVVRHPGDAGVMTGEDWPVANPGPGQVRIKQTAIGVNFVDIYQRSGLYPVQTPFVAGNEGVGLVVAIGEAVDGLKIGDRVAYQGQIGGYCQERLVSANRAITIPDGLADATVAAMMLKGMTAYYLLFKTWALARGETILFHAAAGGVGQIACQWAKALGVRVIGTVGSAEKVAAAKANGCDAVINYHNGDFAAQVRELTNGKGVDVVYDGVGRATFDASLDCLRPRGLMVSFGNASGPVSVPDLGVLARKGSLFLTRPTTAHYFDTRADLLEGANALFAVVNSGGVTIKIGGTYGLAQAADAHRALEGRRTSGPLVLIP